MVPWLSEKKLTAHSLPEELQKAEQQKTQNYNTVFTDKGHSVYMSYRVFNTNRKCTCPSGQAGCSKADITSVATDELPAVLTENGAFCLEMLLRTFVGNFV